MRIVSLLPAATDLVVALGLGDALVGVTHECDAAPGVPVVTTSSLDPDALTSREISDAVAGSQDHAGSSLYGLDADVLRDLRPDLVLTQDLCDVCAVSYARVGEAVRLLDGDVRVASLEPTTLDEVLGQVATLGDLCGVPDRAQSLSAMLRLRLARLRERTAQLEPRRVVALEWLDPVWPVGHWVPEQVAAAGGVDLLGRPGEHTTATTWDAVREAAPDVLLLLPCGLPVDRTLREWPEVAARLPGVDDVPAVRAGQVWALDGPRLFNRPGPEVLRGAEVLAAVLHGVDDDELEPGEAVQVPAVVPA